MNELVRRFVVDRWPLAMSDRVGGYSAYGLRKGKVAQGELPFMHVVFEPVPELVTEIAMGLPNSSKDLLVKLPLPAGYGEFLMSTNGGYFFSANLTLFGVEAAAPATPPEGHVSRFSVPDIVPLNVYARHPLLRPDDVLLGSYFASQQLVVFDCARGSIVLTKPFSRASDTEWQSFDAFVEEEFSRLAALFEAAG